ncbi:MAG: 4Fe-4S binding protein [Deltaproteobacteria bacterium]|nr:4Fe-4S binding protein [Deltaproteobacteria bacterium]
MKIARRIVQFLSLGLFVTLLSKFFVKFDPLTTIIISLSARTLAVLWSLLLLPILTVLWGRFFCGWFCPVGCILDICGYFLPGKWNALYLRNFKYLLLTVIGFAALFAVNFVWIFDPLSSMDRAVNLSIFSATPLWLRFIVPLVFAFVIGANFVQRRFWCRNICPLGALLGILAKFSLTDRIITDNCTNCQKCENTCPMGNTLEQYSKLECIQCRNCSNICPNQAVKFRISAARPEKLDISKRSFFISIGVGITSAAVIKTEFLKNKHPIRPPGAVSENKFVSLCTRCGECMKVCPSNGLQPAFFDAGIEGIFTPMLKFRVGACEEECTSCGKVCPTGAIERLTEQEKRNCQIGLAVIDRTRCLPWAENVLCLVCHDACPYEGIDLRYMDDIYRPFVKEWKCIGCGICENRCPIQGKSAIEVIATRL